MNKWSFRKLEVKGCLDSISASTCINSYEESFAVADLEGMAEQMVGKVINREHSYYLLPVGRTIKAVIVPIEDGKYAIKTLKELYIDPTSLKGGFSVAITPPKSIPK